MGKDKEKKTTNEVVINEENVKDMIKNGNLLKDANVQTALENIKKKEDEHQVQEATNMIMCAKYVNTKELLQLRARRREEKITKEALTKSKELLDEVLSGKLTPTEYKKKKSEIAKEKSDAMRASDNELKDDINELRNSYTGNYRYMAEWDY
jgi:hypothetical protein